MYKKELYEKTVNILLDAYNKGMLEHGNCTACAVGNMVQQACGYNHQLNYDGDLSWIEAFPEWRFVFLTYEKYQELSESSYSGLAKEQIDSTGYTWKQLAEIEYAFESSISNTKEGYNFWRRAENQKQGQFIGLTAVLKVLKEIHETEPETHNENQEKLKEIYELVNV